MKSFEDLTIEQIKELDGELLKDEEIDSLWLNPNIKELNELGDSVNYNLSRWVDVQLTNGESINVYYKRYSANGQ